MIYPYLLIAEKLFGRNKERPMQTSEDLFIQNDSPEATAQSLQYGLNTHKGIFEEDISPPLVISFPKRMPLFAVQDTFISSVISLITIFRTLFLFMHKSH